ncbi:MAG: serine hydroxymethyltransferase [Candidatus Omnitrophica bacterium]|nr:serine hydroxymethyltransferase [Candidatus Omnitrophota bacterium]
MDFKYLAQEDKEVFEAIKAELRRQREHIELIASENFTYPAVMEAQASVLTNKYAEGYPGARWYGGCKYVDMAEDLARERVKKLFGCEYANVQPHSGTQANMAVMMSLLEKGDTILAMDLACGGHLSHGHPLNFSGKFYHVVAYGVNKETELIDFSEIEAKAKQHRPRLIIAGASAYPRIIDFKKFREIADKVGAYLLVDMAHFAGLVAAGIYPNPCLYADVVTSTTHKTLRGPRGGFILAKKELGKKINTAVFPGVQGGPLMHVIAAKAVAFGKALQPEFKKYQSQIAKNAVAFSDKFKSLGVRVVSGGTDTHLLLLDLRSLEVSGKKASQTLEEINITVNKNLIPFDPQPPMIASGIRIGSPAITARGMKEKEAEKIAEIIYRRLKEKEAPAEIFLKEVAKLTTSFPLYSDINMIYEKQENN